MTMKGILQHFANYTYLLSCGKLDDKIDTTFIFYQLDIRRGCS